MDQQALQGRGSSLSPIAKRCVPASEDGSEAEGALAETVHLHLVLVSVTVTQQSRVTHFYLMTQCT